jgi:hypothetical protein
MQYNSQIIVVFVGFVVIVSTMLLIVWLLLIHLLRN